MLLKDSVTFIDTYCMQLLQQPLGVSTQPLAHHSRQPLVQWGLRSLLEGATLSLSETDGRCRQKCRSPSPRETRHAGGVPVVLLLEIGGYDCKVTLKAPQTCS